MDPPRPPRPPPRDPRADPITTPPAHPARFDTDPHGTPAVRPRAPSSPHHPRPRTPHEGFAPPLSPHERLEDRFNRHEVECTRIKTEDRAQFASLRMRQETLEAKMSALEGEVDTGQQSILQGNTAATYKALVEEERRKRAEIEKTLSDKNAEEERSKRLDTLTKLVIALTGLILGFFAGILGAKGIHLP